MIPHEPKELAEEEKILLSQLEKELAEEVTILLS
jgi:hypothetical protein